MQNVKNALHLGTGGIFHFSFFISLCPLPSALCPFTHLLYAMSLYTELGIHQVSEADVLDFINTILEVECKYRFRNRLKRSIHRYFVEFRPEDRLFVALSRDGAIRAVLAVDRLNDTAATLKWIFVGAEDRGRGLGSQLIDRAVDFAKASGYLKLTLGTMRRMEAARRLYQKKGFVFKKQVTYWRRPMLIYEKTLTPDH